MYFMTINGTDILVIKDKETGWIYARISKDKTMESTIDIFYRYITSYDRPQMADHSLTALQNVG